jgi:hypothetical protein
MTWPCMGGATNCTDAANKAADWCNMN